MEIPKITKSSINFNEDKYIFNELQPILKTLEHKTINQFFEDSINEINEIFEIISNIHNYSNINKISKINSIITLEFNYLKYAISQNSIKHLFIFFILNDEIKIRFNNFNMFINLTNEELIKLSKLLYFFLKNSCFFNSKHYIDEKLKICSYLSPLLLKKNKESYYFKINTEQPIKFSENTILIFVTNKGHYSEIKWSKLYSYQYNLINNLKWTLINLNFNLFINLIENKRDIYEIIILLDKLNINEIYRLSEENLSNKWVVYELIHIICLNQNNTDIDILKKLITTLYYQDIEFFINVKNHFLENDLFNKSYIKLLSELPKNKMLELWLSFKFNEFNNLPKNNLFSNLVKGIDKNKLYIILTSTMSKYEEYLNNLKENNKHANFLITDYSMFIIYYYCNLVNKDKIIDNISNILHDIEYLDSNWYLNKTTMKKENYLKLTKLYFLSFAYNHHELNEITTSKSLNDLLIDKIYVKRLLENKDYEYLSKIKQNMSTVVN